MTADLQSYKLCRTDKVTAMPADLTSFRAIGGRFLAIFINFMTRRAQIKAAMRVNTVRVRSCCHAFCLVFFESTLLYREGDVEKNPGPTDSVASNGAANTRSDSSGHDRHDNDNDTNLSGIAASIKTLIRAYFSIL